MEWHTYSLLLISSIIIIPFFVLCIVRWHPRTSPHQQQHHTAARSRVEVDTKTMFFAGTSERDANELFN